MERTTRIVIVEDEILIAMDMKQCLEELGYIVECLCTNAEEALENILKFRPDLVLLDIMLQGEQDGISIAPIIQNEYNVPVVYVTAHSDAKTLERAEVTCPYGYLVKPIEEQQLNSTIKMAIFRSKQELHAKALIDDNIIVLSPKYSYDLSNKELLYEDKAVDLTKRERELFELLIHYANNTVSYEMIEKAIWNERPTTNATLRSLIRRIRDKLNEEIIENVTSVGYRIKTS